MIVSISTQSNRVFPHFGRAPQFTIINIENGKLIEKRVVSNPGHKVGNIPKFMHEHNVDFMLTGGMGHRAKSFFDQYKIHAITGVNGTIEDVIQRILNGEILDLGGESLCSPGSGKGFGIDKIHDNGHYKNCDE